MSLTNSPSVETYKAYASRTLDSARELGPKIRAAADEIEQGRRLPMHLVREMQRTGMLRMAMPRSSGRSGLDFLTQIRRCRSRPGK